MHEAQSLTIYTYVMGDDLLRLSRRFYETQDSARKDVTAFRRKLIRQTGRCDRVADMRIVRMETVPITPKALVDMFNDIDGKLGGFILSREVVEVVTEPQLKSVQAETSE